MLAVHGHGEATSIQWIDAPATELEDVPGASRAGRRARRRAERDAAADDESPAGDPGVAAEPEGSPAATGEGPGLVTNGHARRRDGPDTVPTLDSPRVPGRHRRSDQVESQH
jgi:hypothetical protein